MTSEYLNTAYHTKVNHLGGNLRDSSIEVGTREFERYLANTPTRQEVRNKNNDITYIAIQKSQQTVVGDRYEKTMLGRLEDEWAIGDLFEWENSYWIIITREQLTIPTHFKGKIRECNHYLKWNNQNQIYQTPGHIITSRAYALEEGQKAGITYEEGSMVVLGIVPANEETLTIKRYNRFIIKGKAWRVVSTDNLSVQNLIFIRLEEDQINHATDDLEAEIADKYISETESEIDQEGFLYSIQGDNFIIWNQTVEYTAYIDDDIADNVIFSLSNAEIVSLINQTTDNPIQLKGNSQGITGTVILSCKFSETVTLTKEIKIKSYWG